MSPAKGEGSSKQKEQQSPRETVPEGNESVLVLLIEVARSESRSVVRTKT